MLAPILQKRQHAVWFMAMYNLIWNELMWFDWPNHFVRISFLIKIIKSLFHYLIILPHVLASQFLVQCCCICLWSNLSFDVTPVFTDLKNFVLLLRLTNDTTYTLLGQSNALLQFHVRCSSIEETWRCFYKKPSFHKLVLYAAMFSGKFFHNLKIKRAVLLIIYTSGFTKNWYHVLNRLQVTFSVSFSVSRFFNSNNVPIMHHHWCCRWRVCNFFIQHAYFYPSFKTNFVTCFACVQIFA